MARAREKSVEIKVEGAFHSGRYSVQGGIMTLHLGTEAKQSEGGSGLPPAPRPDPAV